MIPYRYLILLLLLLAVAVPVSALPGSVLFTFDDNNRTVYSGVYPILSGHGYNATFYTITNYVGSDEGKANLTELTTMYNAGWDIASHTQTHTTLTTLSLEAQENEMTNASNQLDAWGFTRSSHYLSPPQGQYNTNTTVAMAATGQLSARTTDSDTQFIPILNMTYFKGVRTINFTEDEQAFLESCSQFETVVYIGHGIEYDFTSAQLTNLANYIDAQNIPVYTITEFYNNNTVMLGSYDVVTLYPTIDGRVRFAQSNRTFAQIIAGSGNGVSSTSSGADGPDLLTVATTGTDLFNWYDVGVISINSSSLDDTRDIHYADLVITTSVRSNGLGNFSLALVNGSLTDNTTLVMGDYQKRGKTELATRLTYLQVSGILKNRNTLSMNAAGLSYISKTGYTIFFLTTGWDVDEAFDGVWASNTHSGLNWYTIETNYDPYLRILYENESYGDPTASFTTNTTSGTVPLAVAFTDTSTNTPTSWNWSFGDGNFSEDQNPEHTYEYVGTFSAYLTATNSGGSDASDITTITVESGSALQCQNQTGNITISLFSNSTTSLGWIWADPGNITQIAEDGLFVLAFDNTSDSFIGTGYLPETWHRLKIYNTTDFGQLNCTTDAIPVTPTPIPMMPSTEGNIQSDLIGSYWWVAVLILGGVVVFKKW